VILSLRNRIVLLTTLSLLVILVILYGTVSFMFSASLIKSVDSQLQSDAVKLKRRLRLEDTSKLQLFDPQVAASTSKAGDTAPYIIWDADKRQPLRRSSSLLRVETTIPEFQQKLPVVFTNQEFAGSEYRAYNELLLNEVDGTGRGLVLQLLHPLGDVHSEVSRLQTLFYWMTPLPLLLVVIGGWWIAGRALQPVRHFIDEVNSINAERLNDRIRITRKDELGELATAFNYLLNRIETTFQSLKRFTADAAHQLRTPLTSIRSMAEIALSRDRDKMEYREKFANVVEEVDHLLELSESLLQLARADAGLMDMNLSPTDTTELLRNWIENLAPLAEEKNIRMETNIQDNVVMGSDSVLLETILVNLLVNAINYTPDNGQIQVTLQGNHTGVDISVCDNGPGIPDDEKSRVFDRFVRLESTRQSVYGSGLGLAIVKAAVDALQGAVSVTDNMNAGSCFHVKLPNLTKTSG